MIRSLLRLTTVPDKFALFGLMRSLRGQMRIGTASALVRCGAMVHLSKPCTLGELVEALDIQEVEMLQHLLELGVRLRLLRRRGGRYVAKSQLARCLARPGENPVASMLVEVATYHREVFDFLPDRLRGEAPRDFLATYGPVIAISSRLMEPWLFAFTRERVGESQGQRILDIGCGSGQFLAFCAGLHSDHKGAGIEMDEGAARAANQRLEEAELANRFVVQLGDARSDAAWPEGSFDIITAHQNVYYFDEAERTALWRKCRERLNEGGKLLIVTPTSGGPMSDYFSLILRSTVHCFGLPSAQQLTSELKSAGFSQVERERMIPGDSLWGIEAR